MATTLQHPFHEHSLTRRQLSENCTFSCNLCRRRVRGTAYCCEDHPCSFFLHESCALVEYPCEITNHPIHPEHPIEISGHQCFCYRCCIELDTRVVIATLPPLEEEGRIQSAAHEHRLTAFHMKVPNWIKCNGCQLQIPGLAYGCHSCGFFLHDSCARLPQEVRRHPIHPQQPVDLVSGNQFLFECDACHTYTHTELAYFCRLCQWKLDVRCGALSLALQDQEKEDRVAIDHFSHQHQLLSVRVEEREGIRLYCAICELQISGQVYHCLACIFFIHKQCADELPQDMAHYLHPEHRLVLLPQPPYKNRSFRCSCCQESSSGIVFHCPSCQFDLDPKCALQTFSAFRDGAAARFQHFSHEEHSMLLRYCKRGQTYLSKNEKKEVQCEACHEPVVGLAYSCDSCIYVLHKSCAELPSKLEHPLHSQHPLILKPDEKLICNNCRSESSGVSFYCTECVFYLCIPCATERPTLKHPLHEHTLSYFRRHGPLKDGGRCNSCGKACSIDLYRCPPCNFNLHSECLPLPPTLQHEYHPYHPLVLFDRFVDGLPEYQYCDYCEELRDPDHGVYRCAECWYTVHIGCALPQVTRYTNPYLDKLRKEIVSLKKTIKVKEKDLEASKQELERLEEEAREIDQKHMEG